MQRTTVAQRPPGSRSWAAAALLVCAGLAAPPAPAQTGGVPAETGTLEEGWSYRPGEGLRIGGTGLALGGYATGDIEQLHGEDHYSQGGANLFVFYTPVSSLRLFADLEVPDAGLERGHLELSANDALNLRVGKLLTPVGRWNTSHIEPLVWTTSEPLLVETVFDDTVSGAMLHGSVFPAGGALSYSVYSSAFEPINADPDEAFADQLMGTHVEWADLGGWTVGASWLVSRLEDGKWNHLGGADFLWNPHPRVELSGELLGGRGSRSPQGVSAGYVQAAIETLPGVHAVFRYEHVSPAGAPEPVNLYDVGLAWVPLSYLRLKVDYLAVDRVVEPAEPGLRASLSFLF